ADNAGNVQTTVSRSVKIDKTKPTTSDDYADSGVWKNSNQIITLTPADATSGVASTKYCTDSANTCDPTSGTSYTTAVTISTEGTTYFRYESTDNAGNVQNTVSRAVEIDKTAPTTTPAASGYSFGNWSNSNVSVTLSCDDGSLSGCSATKYCTDTANTCTPTTTYSG